MPKRGATTMPPQTEASRAPPTSFDGLWDAEGGREEDVDNPNWRGAPSTGDASVA